MKNQAQCPAASVEHNTLGDEIARCGISGLVQIAADSPCCDRYVLCPVWRKEKERLWRHHHAEKTTTYARTDGSFGWEKA